MLLTTLFREAFFFFCCGQWWLQKLITVQSDENMCDWMCSHIWDIYTCRYLYMHHLFQGLENIVQEEVEGMHKPDEMGAWYRMLTSGYCIALYSWTHSSYICDYLYKISTRLGLATSQYGQGGTLEALPLLRIYTKLMVAKEGRDILQWCSHLIVCSCSCK